MHDDYAHKHLILKRFGWKRVANNTMRFGWQLNDAEQHTTTTIEKSYEGTICDDKVYIKENQTRRTSVSIHLYFSRRKSDYNNIYAIFPLELLYNICFLIRRIIGAILPIAFMGIILVVAIGSSDLIKESGADTWLMIGFGIWLGLIILEGVLSRIAGKILGIRLVKRK